MDNNYQNSYGSNQQQEFANLNDFREKPNNNMALAIVSTVLGLCSPCCIGLVLGVIAIIFATQVDTKYNSGDYDGADKAASNAKLFSMITLGLFVVGMILNIVVLATGGMEEYMRMYQEILEQSR